MGLFKFLAHSTDSKFCKSDYNSSFLLTLLWYNKRLKIISQSDTHLYPFINQFVDGFFPDIGSILEAIWEAFKPLVVEKTGGVSEDVALCLPFPIFFNLESFFEHQPRHQP